MKVGLDTWAGWDLNPQCLTTAGFEPAGYADSPTRPCAPCFGFDNGGKHETTPERLRMIGPLTGFQQFSGANEET